VEAACAQLGGAACAHGTFVAGMLVARRGSRAPAICPGCSVAVYPIFRDGEGAGAPVLASAQALAQAIVACVAAGAQVVNISAAMAEPSTRADRRLSEALDHAAARGVLVVASAGNQATLGGSVITRHPWVIAVAAHDRHGRPMSDSNLGSSVGRRGLGAPGEAIESLDVPGGGRTGGGTSCAAAFVSGTVALLCSLFPKASASEVKRAVTLRQRRRSVTPPLLDAESAFQILAARV